MELISIRNRIVWLVITACSFAALFIAQPAFAANTKSISFDDTDEYLYTPDSASLSITGDMTVEMWVKFNDFSETWDGILVSKYGDYSSGSNYQRAWQFGYYRDPATGYNFFNTRTSTDGLETVSLHRAYPLATSTWYHLVFIYDASEGYIDIYAAEDDDSEHFFIGTEARHKTSLKDTTSQFEIASSDGAQHSSHIDGFVDDVRVWNKVRTIEDIDNDFKTELTGSETNLAGYWTFDDTLSDETSNNNDLTNYNSNASFNADVPFAGVSENDYAAVFNGTNQYLYAPDSASLSITGDLTVELWANFDEIDADYGILASKYGGGTSERAYQFSYNEAGGTKHFESIIDNTGSSPSIGSTTYALATSTWYHIAYVYTAASGTVNVYLATTSAAVHTHVGTMTGMDNSMKDSISQFRLATSHGAGSSVHFKGKMDDVRVWNDVRTVSELNANSKTELVGTESNLKAYWTLDNSLVDLSGNSNSLSNVNSVTFSAATPF